MGQEGETTRREYLLLDAIDPTIGQKHVVQVSYERLRVVARRGQGFILEARYTLPEVLLKPTAVFEGLCSDEDEDARGYGWRCYCGIPACRYRANGDEMSVPENRVFLVFVNIEWVAYNWRWEPTDEDRRDLPIGYRGRFKRNLI